MDNSNTFFSGLNLIWKTWFGQEIIFSKTREKEKGNKTNQEHKQRLTGTRTEQDLLSSFTCQTHGQEQTETHTGSSEKQEHNWAQPPSHGCPELLRSTISHK